MSKAKKVRGLRMRWIFTISVLAAFLVNLLVPSIWEILVMINPSIMGNAVILLLMIASVIIAAYVALSKKRGRGK